MVETAAFAKSFTYGLGLLYGVQKFFALTEDKLNEDTKTEIALWMLDVNHPKKHPGNLVTTFIMMFDRVFGPKCFSIHFFLRSMIATLCFLAVMYLADPETRPEHALWTKDMYPILGAAVLGNIGIDYVSLTLSRKIYGRLQTGRSAFWRFAMVALAPISSLVMVLCFLDSLVRIILGPSSSFDQDSWGSWAYGMAEVGIVMTFRPAIVASLIASIWLWLYVAAGSVIRAGLRLPVGIPLLNRRFDVEHKPLQCLGMMAGLIVAVCYWGWVVVTAVI